MDDVTIATAKTTCAAVVHELPVKTIVSGGYQCMPVANTIKTLK